jgi:phosphomannomutase
MSQLIETLTYRPVELAFGTSGLRGLVTDMTDLECYINAAGFLELLKGEDHLSQGDTVHLAGDLRDSTPRIMGVMAAAIEGAGFQVINHSWT